MEEYSKTELQDFRSLFKEMIESKELENQEDVNQAYEAFVEDFSGIRGVKFYDKAPILTEKAMRKTDKNFNERPILRSTLHKNNVLLSSKLYRKVMLIEKQKTEEGFVVSQGDDRNILELTQLQIGYDKNNNPLCFVKLIRVKLDELFFHNKQERLRFRTRVKNVVQNGRINSLEDIKDILDKSRKYSLQEYFLPEGYTNKFALRNGVLLFRFERVYRKNIKPGEVIHHNYAMPNYFNAIYPEEINSDILLKEPHFHFIEGASSLSKQDDVNDKQNNFAAGYAMPCCNVRGYIMKLTNENYKSEEDKNFFLTNDFGMPFLNIYKKDINQAKEILHLLNSFSQKTTPSKELIKADKLIDLISSTKLNVLEQNV